jgi:sulfur-oxidizing protein SoxZ
MARNKITAVKVKVKNGVATAKMVFSHPMMTYNQAEQKTGNREDANFITHITGKVGDETVLDISTSQFFSKNPIFKFQFKCDSFDIGEKLTGRELDRLDNLSKADREKELEKRKKGDKLTIYAWDRAWDIENKDKKTKGKPPYVKSVELASRKKKR